MGLIEAVKESSRTALEDPVIEHIAVVAIYIGLTAIGQVVPFGIIFTLPIATIFILYVFEEQYSWEAADPEAQEEEAATPPPPPPQQEQQGESASPKPPQQEAEDKSAPPEPPKASPGSGEQETGGGEEKKE